MEKGGLGEDWVPQTHSERGMRSPQDLPSTCSVNYSVHVHIFIEPQNDRMDWVEKDHNDHLISTPLLCPGSPATRPGCSEPHPAWSWMPSGMGHPQLNFPRTSWLLEGIWPHFLTFLDIWSLSSNSCFVWFLWLCLLRIFCISFLHHIRSFPKSSFVQTSTVLLLLDGSLALSILGVHLWFDLSIRLKCKKLRLSLCLC